MINRKEYYKKYYQKNKEHLLGYSKKYNTEHKEQIKEYYKKWVENNSDKKKKNNKRYYENNLKKIKERNKKFHKQFHKQYFQEHKENLEEYLTQWRKKNNYCSLWKRTEKGRANNQRSNSKRRARLREIINTLTSEEWLDILTQHNFKCAYCGKELINSFDTTRDHIIPISKGGNNTKENIVPSCRSCNSKKYNKILEGVK